MTGLELEGVLISKSLDRRLLNLVSNGHYRDKVVVIGTGSILTRTNLPIIVVAPNFKYAE
jgi:hypothetical protein